MKGGTLFSGIGTPELSAPWIKWRWCAETDPFASAVLAARFPHTRNHGDVSTFPDAAEPVELIVFGSPCQSFSVAGKRAGLDDPRGNMALIGLQIINRMRPRWLVFENVPGLLSSDGWRDFGAFLGLLGECGYGFAYRILDAQYFGVPQRRRRVFVVGYLGDWRPAAAVLFEPESLRGYPPPRREAGQGVAAPLSRGAERDGDKGYAGRHREDDDNLVSFGISPDCFDRSGEAASGTAGDRSGLGVDCEISYSIRAKRAGAVAYGGNRQSGPIDVATAVNAHGGPHGRQDFETETFITHSLRAEGFDAGEDGAGRGPTIIPILEVGKGSSSRGQGPNGAGFGVDGDPMFTLQSGAQHAIGFEPRARGDDGRGYDRAPHFSTEQSPTINGVKQPAVAFQENLRAEVTLSDIAKSLNSGGGKPGQGYPAIQQAMSVRRLTPRECERLQGFPDDFTMVRYHGKLAADGPRYRALGNAMAVPVIGWILRRVTMLPQASKAELKTPNEINSEAEQ